MKNLSKKSFKELSSIVEGMCNKQLGMTIHKVKRVVNQQCASMSPKTFKKYQELIKNLEIIRKGRSEILSAVYDYHILNGTSKDTAKLLVKEFTIDKGWFVE